MGLQMYFQVIWQVSGRKMKNFYGILHVTFAIQNQVRYYNTIASYPLHLSGSLKGFW